MVGKPPDRPSSPTELVVWPASLELALGRYPPMIPLDESAKNRFMKVSACTFMSISPLYHIHSYYIYIIIYTKYYIIYWHNILYLKNIISSTLLLVLEQQGNNSTFDATLQCLAPLGTTCCNTICINEQFVHTTRTHLWSLGAKNYGVTNICLVSCECTWSNNIKDMSREVKSQRL